MNFIGNQQSCFSEEKYTDSSILKDDILYTFATPINCRPFEWGVDIVIHSTTKYMDGHAVSVGGAIVDSGNFAWETHAGKFPGLTEPDESCHGLAYRKCVK